MTCHANPCTVHRQAVTHALVNNTSQNKPTQQKPGRQLSPTLPGMLASKVSSNCALGVSAQPLAAMQGLNTMQNARLASRRAKPHTRPTVRSSTATCYAGLSKAPTHTSCCATNHDDPTQPRSTKQSTRHTWRTTSQNKPTQQRQRRRQAHSHLQSCSPQRSPLTVHLGLPVCTHSSQPRFAGSNHHAPPPALAHLRWCHLAQCQVGRKARALPHTRPTVRSSMANRSAGLSKAPVHTACCATNHDEPTQPSNIQGFRANTTASSKL